MTDRLSRRGYLTTVLGVSATAIGSGTGIVADAAVHDQSAADCRMFRCDPSNNTVRPNGSGPSEAVEELWRFDTGGNLHGQPILADGTVFVADTDESVYAVDGASGTEQWSVGVDSPVRTTPMVTNGLIVIPARDRLLALSAETGTGEWQFQSISKPGPLIFDDSNEESAIYVISEGDKSIRRMNPVTGQEAWETGLFDGYEINTAATLANGKLYATEIIDTDGNRNQAGHTEKKLYLKSWSADDGSVELEHELGAEHYNSELKPDLYITSHNGYLYYFNKMSGEGVKTDAASGNVEWSIKSVDTTETYPVYANSLVYFATDSNLVAIDPTLGTKRWSTSISGKPTSPIYADGTLYFGSTDNNVYAYDAETGDQQWNFSIGGDIEAPPVVTDDIIYVASKNGSLYALTETDPEPSGPDVNGDGNSAQDLDGDGLYEDVNGDGSFTIVDVQALFANLDSDAVQENADLFDFNGDGGVNVSDVQALYDELQ